MKEQKQALPNITGSVFSLDAEHIKAGIRSSRASRRKRIILPVHRTRDSSVQRMLNFLQPGSYIRPHMHPGDQCIESIIVLQGSIRFYTFDDAGTITNIFTLPADSPASVIDIEPRVWHTFLALKEDTIVFEVKKGPYDPQTDKEFASWAPEEFTDEAVIWMNELIDIQ